MRSVQGWHSGQRRISGLRWTHLHCLQFSAYSFVPGLVASRSQDVCFVQTFVFAFKTGKREEEIRSFLLSWRHLSRHPLARLPFYPISPKLSHGYL